MVTNNHWISLVIIGDRQNEVLDGNRTSNTNDHTVSYIQYVLLPKFIRIQTSHWLTNLKFNVLYSNLKSKVTESFFKTSGDLSRWSLTWHVQPPWYQTSATFADWNINWNSNHQDGSLMSHVIKNKHLEQSVTIWWGYFHSFFNHRNPKYTEYTTVYISQTSKNYHDDEHFYRTKISIFSTTKNRKINRKRFKMFKWR